MDIEELIGSLRRLASDHWFCEDAEEAADILERISKLPEGWDEVAGTDGFNCSAAMGQCANELRATWEN